MSIVQILGPNILVNGGFESGINSWSITTNSGGNAIGSVNTGTPIYEGDFFAHFNVRSLGASYDDILMEQKYFNVHSGVNYRLDFASHVSTMDTPPKIITSQISSVSGIQSFSIDTKSTFSEYVGSFSVTQTDSVSLKFAVGADLNNLFFDMIQLRHILDINPGYDSEFVKVIPRVDNRTFTGALKTYIGKGSIKRWRYPLTWVDSMSRGLINSWWETGASLTLVEDSTSTNSGIPVKIMGVEEPFTSFEKPYQGVYYRGEIILETL